MIPDFEFFDSNSLPIDSVRIMAAECTVLVPSFLPAESDTRVLTVAMLPSPVSHQTVSHLGNVNRQLRVEFGEWYVQCFRTEL